MGFLTKLLTLLVPLLAIFLYWNRSYVWNGNANIKLQYDYIVVGAGSSGSVLASRLSEDPTVNVLLLEAGKMDNIYTEYPLFIPHLQTNATSWEYRTQPQTKSCLGLKNQVSNWPRGKILGGSSSINYMLYVRGNEYDYNQWARGGAEGWSYEEVLPYFIKSEGNRSPRLKDSPVHGTEGPLTVEDSPQVSPITEAFLETAKNLGFKIKDYNDGKQEGYGLFQMTLNKGTRMSSARAFLRPAMHRENLHVATQAFVEKVLINSKKEAEGVVVTLDSKTMNIKAKREVILSAGAIGSPQLLMISGVGPADELEKHKIPVVQNLQGVGSNLQDHIGIPLNVVVREKSSLVPEKSITFSNIYEFFMNGKGPFSTSGVEAVGFIKTKLAKEGYPDIQIHFFTPGISGDGGHLSKLIGVKDNVYEKLFKSHEGKDQVTFVVTLLRPKSSGKLQLRSKDVRDHPLIDPNYLSSSEDIQKLVEGIKMTEEFWHASPFSNFRLDLEQKHMPGCEGFTIQSDDYRKCYLRHLTMTIYHPVGTCKMGAVNDPLSVVDPSLRVKGIRGLRVVDASVMPAIPSGNTNAPAIMIGEKAADIIKAAWKQAKATK